MLVDRAGAAVSVPGAVRFEHVETAWDEATAIAKQASDRHLLYGVQRFFDIGGGVPQLVLAFYAFADEIKSRRIAPDWEAWSKAVHDSDAR